jgi:hypothetical protein
MANTLFTNVRILDGSGGNPVPGSVLVQGNRIKAVGRSNAAISPAGAAIIDGAGATLMPGMCEAHTHFSWNDAATLAGIQTMPLEEHVLWCATVARRYLEAGFTSCVGAACAKPRLDVVIRNAIDAGQIPGPRYLAASQEITVLGALGDETLPHLPFPSSASASTSAAPKKCARPCACSEVRRRFDQAQSVGRQLHAAVAGRDQLDDRCRGGGRDGRGAHARQARHRSRALSASVGRRCVTAST